MLFEKEALRNLIIFTLEGKLESSLPTSHQVQHLTVFDTGNHWGAGVCADILVQVKNAYCACEYFINGCV